MIRNLSIFVLCAFCSVAAQATPAVTSFRDSLLLTLDRIETEEQRLAAISRLLSSGAVTKPFTRIVLAQRGQLLAEAAGDTAREYQCLAEIARVWEATGNRIKAEDAQNRILAFLQQHPNTRREISACRRIGENRRARGDYDGAISMLTHARHLAEQAPDPLQEALTENRLAAVYFEKLLACAAGKATAAELASTSYFDTRAGIPIHTAYLDSTLTLANHSLAAGRSIGNKFLIASNVSILGALHTTLNRYSEAKQYFTEGIALCRATGARENLIELLRNAAELESRLGNYTTAVAFVKEADTLSLALNNLHYQEDTALRLSQLFTKMGSYAEAYRQLNHAYELQAKINRDDEQNRIQNATMELELQHLGEQLSFESERRLFTLITLSGITLTVLLVAFLLYRQQRRQKAANQELERKNATIGEQRDELARVNAGKDKLFSMVAHDLKSPVWSVVTYAELLEEQYDEFTETERKEALAHIAASLQAVSDLLQNLLTWASLQLHRITPRPELLHLHAINRSVQRLFAQQIRKKEITLIADIAETCTVYCDASAVQAVLQNLMSNAVKFTPRGGTVRVTAATQGNHCELRVENSGEGVPAATAAALFKNAAVNSANGTEGEKGTGLGLLLCKDILAINGGTLYLENKPGAYAAFMVTLPAVAPAT